MGLNDGPDLSRSDEPDFVLPRRSLAGHREFSFLLERIAKEIGSGGSGKPAGLLSIDGVQHAFLLRAEYFEVVRIRHSTARLGCIVCQVHSPRRYTFFVRRLDGQTRGPVGSSCIFRHVLGLERARRYAGRLHKLLQSDPAVLPDLEMQEDEFLDYEAYLRRLSLSYLSNPQLRSMVRLTPAQAQTVQRALTFTQPLPAALYLLLLEEGLKLEGRLMRRPLDNEQPWSGHAESPVALADRNVSEQALVGQWFPLQQNLNFQVLTMSVSVSWTVEENGMVL